MRADEQQSMGTGLAKMALLEVELFEKVSDSERVLQLGQSATQKPVKQLLKSRNAQSVVNLLDQARELLQDTVRNLALSQAESLFSLGQSKGVFHFLLYL